MTACNILLCIRTTVKYTSKWRWRLRWESWRSHTLNGR